MRSLFVAVIAFILGVVCTLGGVYAAGGMYEYAIVTAPTPEMWGQRVVYMINTEGWQPVDGSPIKPDAPAVLRRPRLR